MTTQDWQWVLNLGRIRDHGATWAEEYLPGALAMAQATSEELWQSWLKPLGGTRDAKELAANLLISFELEQEAAKPALRGPPTRRAVKPPKQKRGAARSPIVRAPHPDRPSGPTLLAH